MMEMDLITRNELQTKIYTLRSFHVMMDRDLAQLYNVETKVLNQAVKRNSERFPSDFRFQLNTEEFENWKSQFVTSNADKMGLRRPPYAFTEQGVAMLSAILKSETAITVSIQIMKAFVEMRYYVQQNDNLLFRINYLEEKQQFTDLRVNQLFAALDKQKLPPAQGIFFEGQLFDAYVFANDLIKSANKSIILIDNYVDESTLLMLSKRNPNCSATIYTQKLTDQLQLDLAKHNSQYPGIEVKTLKTSHDRFLILDRKDVYHVGASLKDLGKKWFAFSKLDAFLPTILEKLKEV
jgi:hypothetical protein